MEAYTVTRDGITTTVRRSKGDEALAAVLEGRGRRRYAASIGATRLRGDVTHVEAWSLTTPQIEELAGVRLDITLSPRRALSASADLDRLALVWDEEEQSVHFHSLPRDRNAWPVAKALRTAVTDLVQAELTT